MTLPRIKLMHYTAPHLVDHQFKIDLVGAGGSGSQMLTCLARLQHAITALGHPGFHVDVYDPDHVSPANIGRQMFGLGDIGHAKAEVLVHRVNSFFGLAWTARPVRYGATHRNSGGCPMIVACVDTRSSRRAILAAMEDACLPGTYLLDLGNRAADGQALLGQIGRLTPREKAPADHVDLPSPYTLLPELVAPGAEPDDAPSCSLAEALERQELFVNDDVTRAAAVILWTMLRHGKLAWHGAFCNTATGRRSVVPVDPVAWERMQRGGK